MYFVPVDEVPWREHVATPHQFIMGRSRVIASHTPLSSLVCRTLAQSLHIIPRLLCRLTSPEFDYFDHVAEVDEICIPIFRATDADPC
jgi:hypothetical protein